MRPGGHASLVGGDRVVGCSIRPGPGHRVTDRPSVGAGRGTRARPGARLEHLLRQPGPPAGRAFDLPGQRPQVRVAHAPAEQIAVADDQRQQVVEIVRQPALVVRRGLQLPVQLHLPDGRPEPAAERPGDLDVRFGQDRPVRARWPPPTSPGSDHRPPSAPPATTRPPAVHARRERTTTRRRRRRRARPIPTRPPPGRPRSRPPVGAGQLPGAARHSHRAHLLIGPDHLDRAEVGEGRDARLGHRLERPPEVVDDRVQDGRRPWPAGPRPCRGLIRAR